MAKVWVTKKIPFWEEVSKPLVDAGHEVTIGEMEKIGAGYQGLLSLLTDKVDAKVLEKAPDLKIISNYAVGFDNVDTEACKAKNIWVTNTPSDRVNESVAEFSWMLMLALARRVNEAGEFMRNAAYTGWLPEIFMGEDVAGKTLAVIGAGRIGSRVAKMAEGMEVKVISFSRSSGLSLEEVLKQADMVSLHVPLTAETTHLINGKTLSLMKRGVLLVNTARGAVVDEGEVVEALRAGILGGYGADVFENEPNPHPELLQMENVILTPHIASATKAARLDMGKIAVNNLLEGLSGKEPTNLARV